ncbi:MAG: hypothetical protein RJA70_2368 [Pseudomonadota bacterium]|jgi:hypothetical protein
MKNPLLRAAKNGLTFRDVPVQDLTYAVWSAACVLLTLCQFYASMRHQLFFAEARAGVIQAEPPWSAPLDDVFIHLDFARSNAGGAPFEWSPGNGYSSGGTSLLYPWVLALGYWLGYPDSNMMIWAGVVAFIGGWSLLWFARHLVSSLPSYARLVLPPLLLSVGALNWSLASGMEVAFFLGLWGLSFSAWVQLIASLKAPSAGAVVQASVLLGAACALLVATRPEATVLVACFVLTAMLAALRARRSLRLSLKLLLWGSTPGACIVLAQHAANRFFTGSWSAAGALVKVELNNPFMTAAEKFGAWWSHVGYQVLRVTNHHFSERLFSVGGVPLSLGWLLWLLAVVPLFLRKTRQAAALLWLSSLSWTLVVALNGQVRWQNERYSMPAVAWLLLNAGTGFAILLSFVPLGAAPSVRNWCRQFKTPRGSLSVLLALTGLSAVSAFAVCQFPRLQGQLWFYGRASRNIHEQHVQVGRRLQALEPKPKRVLLGDAGAIPFVSNLPALDIIGLGGYHQLPFARASRIGLGAALELVQRLPERDLPDIMAIYPSWWGDLPIWFGTELFAVPVRGNVICGGPSKVVYRTDWTALRESVAVYPMKPGERLVTELDFGDLVSEHSGNFQFGGSPGYVHMKLLPHPLHPERDYWDAGREIAAGSAARFELTGLRAGAPSRLQWLFASPHDARLTITVDGQELAPVELKGTGEWLLRTSRLPTTPHDLRLELRASGGSVTLYHLWALQGSDTP